MKEKLNKEGKEVFTNWEAKFTNVKSTNPSLLTNLNGSNTEIDGTVLKSWCNTNI